MSMRFEPGDRVELNHLFLRRLGKVIMVTPTEVLVRVKTLIGSHKDVWRSKKEVKLRFRKRRPLFSDFKAWTQMIIVCYDKDCPVNREEHGLVGGRCIVYPCIKEREEDQDVHEL